MFKSAHSRARTVATTGVIAALAVAGVAVAQSGNGSGNKSQQQGQPPSGKRMPPPPGGPGGPLGKAGKSLTYGQLHVQRNGEDEVIRLDSGKVTSISDDSITLKENDGNEVTIAVDEKTRVLAGPGRRSSVTDLKEGQQVIVCGPEGEAAKTIAVPPKRGQMPHGQFGGPQNGPGQMQG